MATGSLLTDFELLNKKDLEQECILRDIQPVGLEKREMVRRLKEFERRRGRGEENEEIQETSDFVDERRHVGDDENEETSNFVDEGEVVAEDREGEHIGFSDSRIRLELIRAEERRFMAEGQAAERKAKAERDRMEMELALLREKAQMGLLRRDSSEDDIVQSRAEVGLNRSKAINVLPSMHENEDPISFFHSFEKVARLHEIDPSEWPKLLPSLLNSTLRQHYNRLSYTICRDFKRIKAEILAACQMNPKYYLDKLRTMHRIGKETYAQFLCRLRDMQEYYLEAKEIENFESLKDDMLAERLKESFQTEIKFFVEARRPTSAEEVAKYADLHFECMQEAKRGSAFERKTWNKPKPIATEKSVNMQSTQGMKSKAEGEALRQGEVTNKTNNGYSNTHKSNQWQTNNKSQDGCFICGQHSHRWRQCPGKDSARVNFVHDLSHLNSVTDYQNNFIVPLMLNGVCLKALRDTGSMISLVNADFVRGKPFAKQRPINVQCAFGKIQPVAMTEVKISSPRFGTDRQVVIKAGVVEGLKVDMILGHDIFVENKDLTDIAASTDEGR